MKPKSSLKKSAPKAPAERVVKDIRRATRRHFSAEDKIRIVLEGLRGEDSIAELCRREGIIQNLYYRWSKDFLEAGKKIVITTVQKFPFVLDEIGNECPEHADFVEQMRTLVDRFDLDQYMATLKILHSYDH